jgi:AraC-like DNA-binding protein
VHEAEPPGWAQFHIVTKGRCLLERYGGEPLRLEAGNLLLLPHGDAHVVRSARRGGSSGMPVRIEYNNAIRIKTNTRDESDTELICGRLHFDAVPDSLVIAALPKTIVLSLGPEKLLDRMRMPVQTIDEELAAARPGAAAVATDLATALFVMMLRVHFEQAASSSDLMKLLASPSSARAVTAMLRAPALDWTLDELAAESHVSRATLVRIFREAGATHLPSRAAPRSRASAPRLHGRLPCAGGGSGRLRLRERIRASVPKTVRDFAGQVTRPPSQVRCLKQQNVPSESGVIAARPLKPHPVRSLRSVGRRNRELRL